MRQLKLGSLFDGSGGFPLAGIMHDIEPVWASEIEPFCIRVTKARFPQMKHLGSVTDVNGAEAEPVDIITFGSPCQDLSVAGKQLGIHEGQRSNLFFEAIRIIKEMRHATADKFPRFAVWENVPGAFSSNKGEDFRTVLEAFCEIGGATTGSVPLPKGGKWLNNGCIVGDGWSLAWKILDAQYCGVPQRRKRIYLIADFGSERAGEILLKPKSLRGHSSQSGEARQGTAADAEGSAGGSGFNRGGFVNYEDAQKWFPFNESGKGYWMPGFGCLRAEGENRPSRPNTAVVTERDGVDCMNPWDSQSIRQYGVDGVWPNLNANSGGAEPERSLLRNGQKPHGGGQPASFKGKASPCAGGIGFGIGVAPTLVAGQEAHCVYALKGNYIDRETAQNGGGWNNENMYTLDATDRHGICYPETARTITARYDSSPCVDRGQNVVAIDCRNMTANEELCATLCAKNEGGSSLNYVNPVCYRQDGFARYTEGIGTLKASGGDVGGGTESIVVERI